VKLKRDSSLEPSNQYQKQTVYARNQAEDLAWDPWNPPSPCVCNGIKPFWTKKSLSAWAAIRFS